MPRSTPSSAHAEPIVIADEASAAPENCQMIPVGVAGTTLCTGGFGEYRMVLDCVDRVFPQLFGSSHGYTSMRVEGPWVPVGTPAFATCLGEGGMLPITQSVQYEVRG